MPRLFRIVTNHKNPKVATQLWKTLGVAAIGWSRAGNIGDKTKDEIISALRESYGMTKTEANYASSQLLTFREIAREDFVMAYEKDNMVALVGKATRGYRFSRDNDVGRPDGPIHYPHQVSMDGWPRPRNFHRKNCYLTSYTDLVGWV